MIVTFAASKGGVGRTTLAAALSVETAARGLKTLIVDLDPQQSLSRWHQLRGRENGDIALLNASDNPERTLRRLKKSSADIVFIDAPATLLRMQLAIDVADVVIAPVRPSPIDVESIAPTVELCDARGKLLGFVLNGIVPRSSMTVGARKYLDARHGGVLDATVQQREEYAVAMLTGKSGQEIDRSGRLRLEVETCWNVIERYATGMEGRSLRDRKVVA